MTASGTEELARFLEAWPQRKLAQARSLRELRLCAEEQSRTIPLPAGCRVEPIETAGVNGELLVPAGADRSAAILFHHGGGHVFGSPAEHRHLAARIAAAMGLPAYNMAYPLAPENPYPAGLDQALRNYRFVLDEGIAPERLIVVGDSAGGNLSAAMLLRAEREGLPMAAGTYLISPWLDLSDIPADHDLSRDPLLLPEAVKAWAERYRAGHNATAPEVSPLFADLANFPPCLIQAGGAELLLREAVAFTRKLAEAGRDVQLSVWKDMVHAWPLLHPDLPTTSAGAFAQAAHWAARLLAA